MCWMFCILIVKCLVLGSLFRFSRKQRLLLLTAWIRKFSLPAEVGWCLVVVFTHFSKEKRGVGKTPGRGGGQKLGEVAVILLWHLLCEKVKKRLFLQSLVWNRNFLLLLMKETWTNIWPEVLWQSVWSSCRRNTDESTVNLPTTPPDN